MTITNFELLEIKNPNNSQNNPITKTGTPSPFLKNTVAVIHSQTEFKRGETLETSPAKMLSRKIIEDVDLIEKKIKDTLTLNAKDYLYLGSSEMGSFSDMGMTLNEEGQLLLIKGNTRDLISGIYHKYRTGREYTSYTVKEKGCSAKKKFTSLYIDSDGRLVGKNSIDNFYYEIKIEKNQKDYSKEKRTESIQISYAKIKDENFESLSFLDKEQNTLTFRVRNGCLTLSTYANSTTEYSCDICEDDLKMPFGDSIKILSAKKTRTCLQIETMHNNKKRIYYIDPKDISVRDMKTKRVSHKPPQNFVCCLGRSPHENYESGQPFTSTRRGNFDSSWILFSPLVNNIRQNVKGFKTAHHQGNRGKSCIHTLNAADIGFRALSKATVKIVRGWRDEIQDDDKTKLITNMAKTHSSLIAKLPDSAIKNKNFTEALTEFMAKMPEKDSLSFDDISKITLFAGIAQGGVPFQPGFFFGLVAAISRTHNITLAKKENGDVCFNFKSTADASLTALAGTGQGSEEILFKAGAIDLLSLLPYEANVILTGSVEKQKSASFDIEPIDMKDFVEKSGQSTELRSFINENLEDVIVNEVTKYGGRLVVEARVPEFRPEIGRAYDKNYAVTPRVTAGLMTTLGMGSVSHTRSKETSLRNQTTKVLPSVTEVESVSLNIKTVTEQKIMPIKYINIQDHDFYSPMPVVENVQNTFKKELLVPVPRRIKGEGEKMPDILENDKENNQLANKINEIITKLDQPKIKQNSIDKLTDIKIIYETKRHNIWRKRTGKYIRDVNVESGFRSDLSKIKRELQNKKRNNLDKQLTHAFMAKFHRNPHDQNRYEDLKNRLERIKENSEDLSIGDQKEALTALYKDVSHFRAECKHRITNVELYGIGSLSDTLHTLLSGIVSIVDTQKITYQQYLGNLHFEYHENEFLPKRIHCDYNFIEKDKNST